MGCSAERTPLRSGVGRDPLPGPAGRSVPRPRLVARLSAGVLGPLTVLVGPPGSGKTALLREWALTGGAPGPVAWVTCDGGAPGNGAYGSGAEPPGLFWHRVARALSAAGVAVPDRDGTAAPGTGPVPGRPQDCLLPVARLAEGLAARGAPVVLVLDGFPTEAGSPCAAGVLSLLAHAGPALRLVVAARGDPPLHLHRHRLAGGLTELRTGALAFDDQEATALLALHGTALPRRAVASLTRRTEGWAAGLSLAARAMARQPDPERYAAQFSGADEEVVGYVVEEVLDGRPAQVRRLLLTTSVLDRVNAALADAVAGGRAGRHFTALVRENAFLEASGQGWYRYHRTIGEALRKRLDEERPGRAAGPHRRAAAWLGDHGLLADAVRHALAADDRPYAHRLIVHHLAIGQVLGLTAGRLPRGLLAATARPPVTGPLTPADDSTETALVTAASALADGDVPACAAALAHAAGALAGPATDGPAANGTSLGGPAADGDRMLRNRLAYAVIRTQLERYRDPAAAPAAADDARRLLALLPREALADRPELRALVSLVRGSAELRRGRPAAAESALTAGLKAAGAAGNGALRRDCLIELALLAAVRGRFRAAAELAATAQRPPLPVCSPADHSHAALQAVRAWTGLAGAGPPAARNGLPRGGDEDRAREPAVALSRRELDVLAHLARTLTTEEIAAELQLSANTVKTHLKSVYRKLCVTRRSAAVRRARELGLLPPQP
ncbi:LuxR C-terminal-related transcriptional regulator [Streptomyces sclerotialus]|uniref:LuxR C-terminal-related transcriptional regulator n=1 Tax=Streptomyces sclerotialus TaxID=1957 RepID=UPI00068BCC21